MTRGVVTTKALLSAHKSQGEWNVWKPLVHAAPIGQCWQGNAFSVNPSKSEKTKTKTRRRALGHRLVLGALDVEIEPQQAR